MNFLIEEDKIRFRNGTDNSIFIKPNNNIDAFVLDQVKRSSIISYSELFEISIDEKYYDILYEYLLPNLSFTFTEDAVKKYSKIIDILNNKRKLDMYRAIGRVIKDDNYKVIKLKVSPLSKIKNVSKISDDKPIFSYNLFDRREEKIYLNEIIEEFLYINKIDFNGSINKKGIVISMNGKKLIALDKGTKEIVERKVLSYGKRI